MEEETKPKHDYRKQGKKNRAAGKRFEIKVREDLEKQGWIVFRNSNDVEKKLIKKDNISLGTPEGAIMRLEPEYSKFSQAKSKWNPFTRSPMSIQSGFPDFVCIKLYIEDEGDKIEQFFKVQFVECKVNNQLSKEEKEKVKWIKEHLKISVIVASKGEKRGTINYEQV